MKEAHNVLCEDSDLMVECQNCAITIGTMLENDEEEDKSIACCKFVSYKDIVHELEDYCELMYRLHEEFISDACDEAEIHSFFCDIIDSFAKILSFIDAIPVRKEAVLLPYNASMWDSLESVYLKFRDDPEWDVYVVPIPYYDKNSDGEFQNMHYEGDRFPADIPITDYKTYNLEKRHPERIFIHNPYDGTNYVTSVHPYFYSKNIKNYTEKLIYVPYFVLEEPISPYDCGNESLIVVPAVIHADIVIVQSEKMRQVYINTMTKAVGENSRQIWENKILGLGSPKFDRVDRLRSNPIDIPPDWKKKILKPDGTNKKVILYNTSVVAMLTHREKMIHKIRNVLSYFKNKTENIVLLWRPHPLLEQTLSAMRPELLSDYNELNKLYREEGYGIYDDTADIDRAIAIADAYYGDPSSVVSLCVHAGIPVMLQNPDV